MSGASLPDAEKQVVQGIGLCENATVCRSLVSGWRVARRDGFKLWFLSHCGLADSRSAVGGPMAQLCECKGSHGN